MFVKEIVSNSTAQGISNVEKQECTTDVPAALLGEYQVPKESNDMLWLHILEPPGAKYLEAISVTSRPSVFTD
jgi:hypothetical protein